MGKRVSVDVIQLRDDPKLKTLSINIVKPRGIVGLDIDTNKARL